MCVCMYVCICRYADKFTHTHADTAADVLPRAYIHAACKHASIGPSARPSVHPYVQYMHTYY